MTSTPLLSVLLTTHTKPRYLEQLLASLLSFESPSLEVILINDASDRALSEALRQVFSRTDHSNAFLFEHDHFQGRGSSLNEALLNARGTLIWAPLRADKLNESLLSETVTRFAKDPAAFWVLDDTLPRDINAWADSAEEGTLPDDSRFVWNRATIPTNQFFFQPAMEEYHGCELAARVAPGKSWQSTDAFFIAPREAGPPADMQVLQEILLTLLRQESDGNDRLQILEALGTLRAASAEQDENSRTQLDQAWQLKDDDPRKALDVINAYIKRQPEDQEAVKLKILLLEKLRRHVEASELKHDLQRKSSGTEQAALFPVEERQDTVEKTSSIPAEQIRLSVVIPTTGDCKPILEECLAHLYDCVDATETELIVIDNASIDDTFDYLEQLQKKNFLNIRVITNKQNRGFGPSVNQGIRDARGPCILIMHNDLFPEKGAVQTLLSLMDTHPDIGLAGPVMDRCDNPEQLLKNQQSSDDHEHKRTNTLDSACMLLRKAANVQFDETLTPAFFDDLDLCNQVAENGYFCTIATNARVTHRHRVTTEAMGLHIEPEQEWRNAGRYMMKWNGIQDLPEPDSDDAVDALKKLELPVNPHDPPADWLALADRLLSDETRTTIHNGKWNDEFLFKLTTVLLIADEREFLRRIETRLDGTELPDMLLKSLIRYYYEKNIYSRCRHYLDKAKNRDDSFYDLYRLRIAVAEKEEMRAVNLLNHLIKLFPCHPELYKLTGDIHRINGNEGEAKSFYALANQLNPALFQPENEPFEIKY